MSQFSKQDLISLKPRFDTFVGVDSDGCVFDTMDAKQCGHFHPLIVKHWGLQAVERSLRDVAEFVNLRSKYRGRNRFPALLKTFELLPDQPDVIAAGITLPPIDDLRAYCESGLTLGNETLKEEVARTGSPMLKKVLAWSLDVNRDIARNLAPVPPFPSALEALRKINESADVVVVSQTPEEALVREWNHHKMAHLARVIGGQELGTKAEQIKLATTGKYDKNRVLLIGDAPGDLEAAQEAGVCFYPVVPGAEENSWRQLIEEAYDVFLAGRYRGLFEQGLIDRFLVALPDRMPVPNQ